MSRLAVTRRGGACEILLDDPPGNILDRALCAELERTVRAEAADPALKAFVFKGAGRHFSYGASVQEHVAGEVERFLPAFHHLFETLMELSVPTVAAVRGMCLGGGLELAAFCDVLVADGTAVFGLPEIELGVWPPVACALLPWRLGGAAAEVLVLLGQRLPAEEAHRLGLVTRLCPAGALDRSVEGLLEQTLEPRSAAALRSAVRALRAPLHRILRQRLPELEKAYLEELMATRDANEGIQAFLEKRSPEWIHG